LQPELPRPASAWNGNRRNRPWALNTGPSACNWTWTSGCRCGLETAYHRTQTSGAPRGSLCMVPEAPRPVDQGAPKEGQRRCARMQLVRPAVGQPQLDDKRRLHSVLSWAPRLGRQVGGWRRLLRRTIRNARCRARRSGDCAARFLALGPTGCGGLSLSGPSRRLSSASPVVHDAHCRRQGFGRDHAVRRTGLVCTSTTLRSLIKRLMFRVLSAGRCPAFRLCADPCPA